MNPTPRSLHPRLSSCSVQYILIAVVLLMTHGMCVEAADESSPAPRTSGDIFAGATVINRQGRDPDIGLGLGVSVNYRIISMLGLDVALTTRPQLVFGDDGGLNFIGGMVPIAAQMSFLEYTATEKGTTRFGADVALGYAYIQSDDRANRIVAVPYVGFDVHLGLVKNGSIQLRYQAALGKTTQASMHGLYLVALISL